MKKFWIALVLGIYLIAVGAYADNKVTFNGKIKDSINIDIVTGAKENKIVVNGREMKGWHINITYSIQPPPTPGSGDGSLNNPWKLNVACTGNLTAYGFNLNWSTQKTIPKGATRYFEVDPVAYTGKVGTGVIVIKVFDYDQSPNVRSTLIVINKNTGVQKATSLFSGAQATQYVRYVPPNPPDEKYIIKCTENGTKDQPLSVWWEFSSMTKPTDY
jgi:hypothetical protein